MCKREQGLTGNEMARTAKKFFGYNTEIWVFTINPSKYKGFAVLGDQKFTYSFADELFEIRRGDWQLWRFHPWVPCMHQNLTCNQIVHNIVQLYMIFIKNTRQ